MPLKIQPPHPYSKTNCYACSYNPMQGLSMNVWCVVFCVVGSFLFLSLLLNALSMPNESDRYKTTLRHRRNLLCPPVCATNFWRKYTCAHDVVFISFSMWGNFFGEKENVQRSDSCQKNCKSPKRCYANQMYYVLFNKMCSVVFQTSGFWLWLQSPVPRYCICNNTHTHQTFWPALIFIYQTSFFSGKAFMKHLDWLVIQ